MGFCDCKTLATYWSYDVTGRILLEKILLLHSNFLE